ncbi:MAG: PKD domain-containing protein [Brumimicrobium sp.]|nr:PKD domain-containing protein [Brumimicrobium sp.]
MKFFSTTFIFLISIFSLLAQPNPDFSASPLTVCVGENVSFTDLSTSSGSITSWTWDFGDGNSSNLQNPTHSYTAAGSYTIILTVSDGTSSEAEVKLNYITVNPLPNPSFNYSLSGGCSLPTNISFQNVLPSGNFSYSWNFGNGQTSTAQTPSGISYTSAGNYNITLTVTNTTTGCVGTTAQSVNIAEFSTDFSYTAPGFCVGTSISFSDASTGGANIWNWDFGNGSTSNQQNPTLTYNSPGTYTVTLTSSNSSNGCTDTHTEQIEILPSPTPSFTFNPNSGCAPLDVTFTNTSTDLTGTFDWDFGDGNTFSGANPGVHTYLNNGSYSVTLTQTDANGCVGTQTLTNIIDVSSITANFQADVTEGCEILEVTFTDLSNSPNPTGDPITSWQWDFGNGNTFNGQVPPIQSYSEGVYTVTLTVSTDAGCSQTLTLDDYIMVGVPPSVDFTWTPFQDCAKSEFEFDNLTTIPVPFDSSELVFQWDFGDGGTSGDVNPTYDYPQDTGYFDVQLIVTFRGCPDTMIYDSAVYIDAPIALFTVPSVFCNPTLPLGVTFDDQSIIGKETDNAEMIWRWGDGSPDSIVTPPGLYNNNPGSLTHTYTSLGTYTVKQVIHNYTTGCSDSITRTIRISQVEALFSVSNDSVCRFNQVNISNNGSNTSHPNLSYSYNMGNGTTLFGPSHNYAYNTAGTYNIVLTVTNSVGCQDTDILSGFEVLELPQANIIPSSNLGCSPLLVDFTNGSISQSGVPLSSFEWTFEDGSTQNTIPGQNTSYTFTGEGVFTTSLTATDEFGCVSPSATVQTELTKPTAAFNVDPVVCNFEEFTALNQSLDFASSEWFVNGNSISTDTDLTASFSHVSSPGTVSFTNDIELIVTDDNGCKDTLQQTVTVSAPHADYDYSFSGANTNAAGDFTCPPVFASLTDQSNSFGNITNWNWSFGDGKFSTLQNPNNTYVFAGTYSSSLIITDEYGCQDTMEFVDYLTIGGPSGELEWTNVGTACDPEFLFNPVTLDGATNVIWIMDDGDTVISVDPFSYNYENFGTYTPTAILVDDNGCNVPYELDTINIFANILDAFFTINPTTVNWGDPVVINDQSTGGNGGIINWFWDTEGEQFSNNGGTFEYYFNTSGEVTVVLTVTDSLGCTDTYQVTVTVTDNLIIPNVLTPNGDGSNDVFVLKNNVFREYTVVILNRWGNVVSETFVEDDVYLWDGLNKNGAECTEGVYFYKVTGILRDGEPSEKHGFVHLVRD